jgi:hypothetical protein
MTALLWAGAALAGATLAIALLRLLRALVEGLG